MAVGRTDLGPCGSGKKYTKCCLAKDEAEAREAADRRAADERRQAEEAVEAVMRRRIHRHRLAITRSAVPGDHRALTE